MLSGKRTNPLLFKVYRNFTPPSSAIDHVSNHITKFRASYESKLKLTSPFLQRQVEQKQRKNADSRFASISASSNASSIYSTDCGGVNIDATNCGEIIDRLSWRNSPSNDDENYLYHKSDDANDQNVQESNTDKNSNHNNKSNNIASEKATHQRFNECDDDGEILLPRNESTFSPISKTAEGYSIWETHLNQHFGYGCGNGSKNRKAKVKNDCSNNNSSNGANTRVVPPFDVFEGNAKEQWIDSDLGWCHLCQEPIGTSSNHVGDRDHACMSVYLYFYSLYPRTWSTRDVVLDALQRFPPLAHNCVGTPFSSDHLHTLDDTQRRLELEALLVHLSDPNSPNQVLTNVLQGHAPISLWVAGERIFKVNLTQLVSEMCLPMGAGIQTAMTQKCWSRTNLERMYDALNVAKIQKSFGAEPKTGRLEKAFFMRSLFFELSCALDEARGDEHRDPFGAAASESRKNHPVASETTDGNFCAGQSDSQGSLLELGDIEQPQHDYFDATKKLLVQECLRRMAFELIFLQSMIYMNKVQYVARTLKYPTWQDLHQWDSL